MQVSASTQDSTKVHRLKYILQLCRADCYLKTVMGRVGKKNDNNVTIRCDATRVDEDEEVQQGISKKIIKTFWYCVRGA